MLIVILGYLLMIGGVIAGVYGLFTANWWMVVGAAIGIWLGYRMVRRDGDNYVGDVIDTVVDVVDFD